MGRVSLPHVLVVDDPLANRAIDAHELGPAPACDEPPQHPRQLVAGELRDPADQLARVDWRHVSAPWP
jgi:hypothetical protein